MLKWERGDKRMQCEGAWGDGGGESSWGRRVEELGEVRRRCRIWRKRDNSSPSLWVVMWALCRSEHLADKDSRDHCSNLLGKQQTQTHTHTHPKNCERHTLSIYRFIQVRWSSEPINSVNQQPDGIKENKLFSSVYRDIKQTFGLYRETDAHLC